MACWESALSKAQPGVSAYSARTLRNVKSLTVEGCGIETNLISVEEDEIILDIHISCNTKAGSYDIVDFVESEKKYKIGFITVIESDYAKSSGQSGGWPQTGGWPTTPGWPSQGSSEIEQYYSSRPSTSGIGDSLV